MNTATIKNIKGLVKLTIKETGNKKYPRPVSDKPFPLIFKSQTFLANGITTGVTESQVKDLIKSTVNYYEIKYVFHATTGVEKAGTKSTDYDFNTVELIASKLGSQDLKTFTDGDVREEVVEWLKDFNG